MIQNAELVEIAEAHCMSSACCDGHDPVRCPLIKTLHQLYNSARRDALEEAMTAASRHSLHARAAIRKMLDEVKP